MKRLSHEESFNLMLTAIEKSATHVQCSFCGCKSNKQNDGDGCHSCLRGVMRKMEQRHESR